MVTVPDSFDWVEQWLGLASRGDVRCRLLLNVAMTVTVGIRAPNAFVLKNEIKYVESGAFGALSSSLHTHTHKKHTQSGSTLSWQALFLWSSSADWRRRHRRINCLFYSQPEGESLTLLIIVHLRGCVGCSGLHSGAFSSLFFAFEMINSAV